MSSPPKTTADSDEPPEITPEAKLAADDPTAVWDADSLREAGLDDLVDQREDETHPPPATPGQADGPPSIVTPLTRDEEDEDDERTQAWDGPPLPERATAHTARRASSGWAGTLTLALVLGTLVYFAVRFLR